MSRYKMCGCVIDFDVFRHLMAVAWEGGGMNR